MTQPNTDILRPLHIAIESGNADVILAALPEPEQFMPALFASAPAERNSLFAGLMSVLETEDQWQLIEAAAMDTVARPERSAFVAIAPLIPNELLADTQALVSSLKTNARQVAQAALDKRSQLLLK